MLVKNEDGTEQEVFTQDELNAQKQAAIDEYKAQNPDRTDELNKLQSDIQEKEKELEGLKDKENNFVKARELIKQKELEIESLRKEVDAKVGTAKKEILEGVTKDIYEEEMGKLGVADEETKKKVQFHYGRLPEAVSSRAEIAKKLREAYILATASESMNMSAFSSGGVHLLSIKADPNKLTDDDKDLLRKMGKGHLVDKK